MRSVKTLTFTATAFIAILFTACKQKTATTNSDTTAANDTIATVATKNNAVDSTNHKYLDYSVMKIYGKVGVYGNYKDLLSVLGKADSVKTIDEKSAEYECGTNFEKPFSVVYIKGATFEMKNDSVVFDAIKFNKVPGAFIQAGNLKLSAATTLAEIQKLYPESTKNGEELSVKGYTEPVFSVSVKYSSKSSEVFWILLFNKKTGKLLEIHGWIPC